MSLPVAVALPRHLDRALPRIPVAGPSEEPAFRPGPGREPRTVGLPR
ncbi:hypothetical protein ACFWIJ_39125 [Streptomyces sp. NPDC127079]